MSYSTIRELMGELVGKTILEITQHDEEYFLRTGRSFIDLMLSDGDVLRFYTLTDGTCCAINPTDEAEDEMFGQEGR